MASRWPVLCSLLAPAIRYSRGEAVHRTTFSTSTPLWKRTKQRTLIRRLPSEPNAVPRPNPQSTSTKEAASIIRNSTHERFTNPDGKYVKLTRDLIRTTIEREQRLWENALERLEDLWEAEKDLRSSAMVALSHFSCPRATAAGYVRTRDAGLSSILGEAHREIGEAVKDLRSLIPSMLAEPLPSEEVMWRREGIDVGKVNLPELEKEIELARVRVELYFKKQAAAASILEKASRQYEEDKDMAALTQSVVKAVSIFNDSSFTQDGRETTEEEVKKVLQAQKPMDESDDAWSIDDDWSRL
ncbi:hypothetical protein K461DRAFT_283297 [Myriangium duriaei CBS 260.36]|uniref:Uncharacterized protein n=1 Tax=Myriangium duriaei CBS 260.36 TaxID=1168546 RepID=A0A9P4MC15_9PEZI|nr:hypothetical protein K461DRAFT_283297 [Myriangium duriaei CBS 260.36]